jgi:N-methylhydantoinase A
MRERDEAKYIIGIDTGGTFTDCVVLDNKTGEAIIAKAPTTPDDFSLGVLNAVGEAAQVMNLTRRELLRQCLMLKLGTTVGTNAVITGKGAKVGFITTKGFEDTTLIGRAIQRVDGLSDEEVVRMPLITKPEPIVPKSRLRGVYERIDFRGRIVVPLNLGDAREQIEYLVEEEKVEAIGVSLLFSCVNPVHEQKIKELYQQRYPDRALFLTFSHELVPLVREYGRANTVILNCFIGKIMEKYLNGLERRLREEGFSGRFLVMQSSGGTISWDRVPPIRTLSSGPSGGVIGSQYMATQLGHAHVISTDMGGTSFDVSLIRDGKWDYEREPIISRWRAMLPMIKVDSIGAGGGTIARVDPVSNRLIVGPESAGAAPGPVCYDSGGTEPTVCDADLLLGFLNPDYFWGGKMKLNKVKAEKAIREKIADPLKMDIAEAAAGIFTIVNAHMADLTRIIAMRSGLSPGEFVVYAFGGTGPMHAAYYAGELGIKEVYVFPQSPVFSAFGIAGSHLIQTASFSLGFSMPVSPDLLNSRLREYQDSLFQEMEKEGFQRKELEVRHTFNMRYRRQVNYHSIGLQGKEYRNDLEVAEIVDSWIRDFERIYGKGVAYTKAGIELVSMDVDVIGKMTRPVLKRYPEQGADPSAALKGFREVFFPEVSKGYVKTAIYEYQRLLPGNAIEGPAVVESPTTTVVVPPGKLCRINPFLHIVLEL